MSEMRPCDLDGVAALVAAENTAMRKLRGERDTEFVKRIVCAYLNADAEIKRRIYLARVNAEARHKADFRK